MLPVLAMTTNNAHFLLFFWLFLLFGGGERTRERAPCCENGDFLTSFKIQTFHFFFDLIKVSSHKSMSITILLHNVIDIVVKFV
jgi:hypothetical protein